MEFLPAWVLSVYLLSIALHQMASTLTEKMDRHKAATLVPVSAEDVLEKPALPLQEAQSVYSDHGVSTPADSCHTELTPRRASTYILHNKI